MKELSSYRMAESEAAVKWVELAKLPDFHPTQPFSFNGDEIVAICGSSSDEVHIRFYVYSISTNAWKSEPIPNAYNSELSNHFLAVDYSKELI